jgi:hypothetical protein
MRQEVEEHTQMIILEGAAGENNFGTEFIIFFIAEAPSNFLTSSKQTTFGRTLMQDV